MIDLLADDGRSAFGVATALEIEGIPYRRITRPEEFDASALIVATRELPPGAPELLRRVPTVVIGVPGGPTGELFGVTTRPMAPGPVGLSLDGPMWPDPVRERARQHGATRVLLPSGVIHDPSGAPAAAVLASVRRVDDTTGPAVLRSSRFPGLLWSLVDLGAALTDLLDERYAGEPGPRWRLPTPALAAYYRSPARLRRLVQRWTYRRLERNADALNGARSAYPVDTTGWLLIELVKALVREVTGGLVRVARWPAPHTAAAALTHDLEPTAFAYGRGLERMLDAAGQAGHPTTFGVVSRAAARHLAPPVRRRLGTFEVMCHGLEHKGEQLEGGREAIVARIGEARRQIERDLGREIVGFRSPRLDRSRDLLWALDRAEIQWDSSYPDVDRENVHGFGGGVRLSVPFRPPIDDEGGRCRASSCLELPLSAPDCIQPLFHGQTVAALRDAVRRKVAFVRATGGLYMGVVHAGVFGPQDADVREAHLRFVVRQLRRADLWVTTPGGIATWWRARERLAITVRDERILVTNRGDAAVSGVRIVVETSGGEEVVDLASVPPGTTVTIDRSANAIRKETYGS